MATALEVRAYLGPILRRAGSLGALVLLFATSLRCSGSTPALGAQLLQPTSVAYDVAGNLYFAESRNHVVRKVDTAGQLTTVAGSDIQGFSGDGGPATAAQLDSPRGVAIDTAGNLYIADTQNNRVRCVDAVTHQIRTLAGTGLGSFSGDNGPAIAASLHGPLGLAVDGSNHLYISDSGNDRLRMVDLTSGVISTIAGNGQQGFSGDSGPAIAAMFNAPSGLVADSYGNLFVSDTGNHRIREVSSATRRVVTLAGDGTSGIRLSRPEGLALDLKGGLLISDAATHCIYLFNLASGRLSIIAGNGQQAFAGDEGLASQAMLDSPQGVAVHPAGAIVVADTNNARLRQISSETGGNITTIAGAGVPASSAILLDSPSVQTYGSATMTSIFTSAVPGSGLVRLSEVSPVNVQQLASSVLTGNKATFDLSALSAGTYQVMATYFGDPAHPSAQSPPVSLAISPLPVSASLLSTAETLAYGQVLPAFTGTLTGVLLRDRANVQANFSLETASLPLSPGSYPLRATLSGSAATNYTLGQAAGTLTITQAPVVVSLTHSGSGFSIGVASSTTGRPTGAIALMTAAGTELASIPVSASGTTTISDAGLTAGTYSVVAIYSGDTDFLSSRSAPSNVTIGGALPAPATPDFSITSTGVSAQSTESGGTATFTFTVSAAGQAMAGPILLAVQGAPSNSSATFTPSLVVPGTTTSSVTLNVILPRSSAIASQYSPYRGLNLVLLFPLVFAPWTRGRRAGQAVLGAVLCLPTLLAGCGDRVVSTGASEGSSKSYVLLVTGTTTLANGSSLQHSTSVNLTVP